MERAIIIGITVLFVALLACWPYAARRYKEREADLNLQAIAEYRSTLPEAATPEDPEQESLDERWAAYWRQSDLEYRSSALAPWLYDEDQDRRWLEERCTEERKRAEHIIDRYVAARTAAIDAGIAKLGHTEASLRADQAIAKAYEVLGIDPVEHAPVSPIAFAATESWTHLDETVFREACDAAERDQAVPV